MRNARCQQYPSCTGSWWRHQKETFSALLARCAGNTPVPGDFPAQRPVTRSFDVFFYLHPNKRLSEQRWDWWFETLSHPLWRHRNAELFQKQCKFQLWCNHWYWKYHFIEITVSAIQIGIMYQMLPLLKSCYSNNTNFNFDSLIDMEQEISTGMIGIIIIFQ